MLRQRRRRIALQLGDQVGFIGGRDHRVWPRMLTSRNRPVVALPRQVAKHRTAMDATLTRDLRDGDTVRNGRHDAGPHVEVISTHATLLSARSIVPSQSLSKRL